VAKTKVMKKATAVAPEETKSTFYADDERQVDGNRIELHLSADDKEFVRATWPVDANGEMVSVAHWPSVIVTDIVTGKMYRVRRAPCGGGCVCAASAVELDEKSAAVARKQALTEVKVRATERKNYLALAEGLGLKTEWLGMELIDFNSGAFFRPRPTFKITGLQKKKKGTKVVIRQGLREMFVPVAKTKEIVEKTLQRIETNIAAAAAAARTAEVKQELAR
jgi:hypothetical protein